MTFRELTAIALRYLADKAEGPAKCECCGKAKLPDHRHELDQPVFEYYAANRPDLLDVHLCDTCAAPYLENLNQNYAQMAYAANKASEAANN